MIEWSESAKRVLDGYCARARARVEGTGADADEVSDDLRRHVEEEARAAKLSIVTEEDVRRILARVGEPGKDVDEGERKHQTGGDTRTRHALHKWLSNLSSVTLLVLGVILPLGVLIFEMVSRISASVLFDPIPNWFSVLAVAFVPAVNFWMWRAAGRKDPRHARLLGWLNGIAIGICIFYTARYVLFTHIAAVCVIIYGLGLIPLAPLLALIATPGLRVRYARRTGTARLPGAWGMSVGFAVLALLQLPTALTYYGLDKTASEESDAQLHGVRVLRNFGDEDIMLRACYGFGRTRELGNMDVVRALASGNRTVSPDVARETYYRVTGRPFNSVPPPSLYTASGRWDVLEDEFSWDDGLGGDAVAGRVKGLSLASSRMDASAEPDAALVYCEWTMEFKNVSSQQREARAQIALPPGAVVSRLTLWINGEEREAAFGGRSQVKEAYKEVVVVQRRDPVLVTTCGPDRILMQCFPVPANGGVMKLRVGITAPLVLESLDKGRFLWPRFLERNFNIAADFKHTAWVASPSLVTGVGGVTGTNPVPPSPFTWRSSLSENDLAASKAVELRRSAEVTTVSATDESGGGTIRQTITPAGARQLSRFVVVVDASVGMKDNLREIAEALADVPETTEISVLVATDESSAPPDKPQKATAAVLDSLRRKVRNIRCVGGQDNLLALEEAWDIAESAGNGVVVWIHEPQPALFSSESGLRQRIERSTGATRLWEIQTRNGPDRVIEKLDGLASVRHAARFDSLRNDLKGLFGLLSGKSRSFELVRERVASPPDAEGPRASKHVARLWAQDESARLASQRKPDAAAKLAAGYQLVTPLTGAVVLETKQQFAKHGLTPAEAGTVPAVPEPSTWALIGVGILAMFLARRRHNRRRVTDG